jgi:uncharacterized membrane protein
MAKTAHLWAVGYENMTRADEVRQTIENLGWGNDHAAKYMILHDLAVVVRLPDGSFTFDRKPFPAVANVVASTAVGFLAGLVLAAPMTGATLGALLGSAGTAVAATHLGISEEFIREVETLMKPGTSALFVLDDDIDMDVIRHAIQGLGGTILKTNVNVEHAKTIQAALAKSASGA